MALEEEAVFERRGPLLAGIAIMFLLVVPAVIAAIAPRHARPAFAQPPPGAVEFDQISDSIGVAGQTVLGTSSTYEGLVYFPAATGATGGVFNEWTDFFEDKQLNAGPTGASGFNFAIFPILNYNASITFDAWHHIAFVQDGGNGEQRLYVDGALVASQVAGGDISDGAGTPCVGSIFRDGGPHASFLGYLDTFRVSDVARYSGNSFAPPSGDLSSDANTLILYNFSSGDFSVGGGCETLIADLSGNNHSGTFAGCYQGSTSPALPGQATPTATITDTATATTTPTRTATPSGSVTATATRVASRATSTATPTSTSTARPSGPAAAPPVATATRTPAGGRAGAGVIGLPDTGAGREPDGRGYRAALLVSMAGAALISAGAITARRRRRR